MELQEIISKHYTKHFKHERNVKEDDCEFIFNAAEEYILEDNILTKEELIRKHFTIKYKQKWSDSHDFCSWIYDIMEEYKNQIKITKTTKTTITTVDTYHLTDEIKYVIEFVNNKVKSRTLKYAGKKIGGYPIYPLYDVNISLLQKTNPYWDSAVGDDWFKCENLPKPENIDLSKIIFCQPSTYLFYDINKEPLPLVFFGGYGANLTNKYYDLVNLREHLIKNPKIVSVSEILDIPYYNCDEDCTKHIDILVLADSEIIKKGLNGFKHKDLILGTPYCKTTEDYLDIKQFLINKAMIGTVKTNYKL